MSVHRLSASNIAERNRYHRRKLSVVSDSEV